MGRRKDPASNRSREGILGTGQRLQPVVVSQRDVAQTEAVVVMPAANWVEVHCVFIEPLPETSAGKIQKVSLSERACSAAAME